MRPAAAPIVLEWGQTAKLAHLVVTVRQPIYGQRAPGNGSRIGYTVTLTNHGRTAVTATATHYADGERLPSSGADPLAGRAVEPGKTDHVEQVVTVPKGAKTFAVDMRMRSGGSDTDARSRKWSGKITGQPTSAAPAPEVTQLQPLGTGRTG